jgi:hypothetical protein
MIDDEHRDPAVLALQEGDGALADLRRDLLHHVGAGVGLVDEVREVRREHERRDGRDRGEVRDGRQGFRLRFEVWSLGVRRPGRALGRVVLRRRGMERSVRAW